MNKNCLKQGDGLFFNFVKFIIKKINFIDKQCVLKTTAGKDLVLTRGNIFR